MYLQGVRRRNFKSLILGAVMVCLVLAFGVLSWQYRRLRSNPNALVQQNTDRLLKEIGQFYQLPDEQPTVAQIQDKDKLKDQAFFDKSQNGDYVIIYTNNKLALLYREKERRLINTGPININDTEKNTNPQP